MKIRTGILSILFMATLAFSVSSCDDDKSNGSGNTSSCSGMCQAASFTDGESQDFGDVIECLCSGSGSGLSKTACETYCATYDISAANSLLSTEASTNDKCVCDGTAD